MSDPAEKRDIRGNTIKPHTIEALVARIEKLEQSIDANGNDINGVGTLSSDSTTTDKIDFKLALDTLKTATIAATTEIDVSEAGVWDATVNQDTTIDLTGATTDGVYTVSVFLEDNGNSISFADTITFESPEGAPEFNNNTYLLNFATKDGGSNWFGFFSEFES
ncbi:hypothetical protein EXE53_16740 [Halorubrum sp. SD626R]|uniref:hypothetical protein n=1 Tax=Halorubrum sp. SD626R TaxID=1419722 RepID=UPI0010F561D2|nr:hypothetical protein [Halorubrum sp. SD626R]TKX79275.1 hypothetical protein EXE53_16740 [Halorubrum sp. SD626R]